MRPLSLGQGFPEATLGVLPRGWLRKGWVGPEGSGFQEGTEAGGHGALLLMGPFSRRVNVERLDPPGPLDSQVLL